MPIQNYDPKLSEAGFMDLVLALQSQLKAADSMRQLSCMPPIQREAALQLGALAKNYVDVVEGRGVPFELNLNAEKFSFPREAVVHAASLIARQDHLEDLAQQARKS